MKNDFPFRFALLVAFLLHAALGVVLKFNPLLAAAPIAVNRSTPLSVRFVEVPPDAKTIPTTPNTNNVSDANRKAGPLVNQGKPVIVPNAQVGQIGPSRQSLLAQRPPAQRGRTGESPLPLIQSPEFDSGGDAAVPTPDVTVPGPKLSESLQNLDQFIRPGGGATQEGAPSQDPGSGVFFDTRGYDLGPWGNRVIAIVKSNWLIPVAADLGLKGVVAISFEVDRGGNILDPKIISSSEIPSFDQAALNAIQGSTPLPSLPADFPRKTLPAVFRFYYNTPVPN